MRINTYNMFALCLFACVALASAAPRYHDDWPHRSRSPYFDGEALEKDLDNLFTGIAFDTQRFWTQFAKEMQEMEQTLNEFHKHFPSTTRTEVTGDEYVVNIHLNGFDEKDINVKAKEGVLMVQAVHHNEFGGQNSYLDVTTLPSNVDLNGTWTYANGELRIVFKVNKQPEGTDESASQLPQGTEEPTYQLPENENQGAPTDERDREEMEPSHKSESTKDDADVGLEGGNKDVEILTNTIPREGNNVEATTYAVDLKDEVEFVTVAY